MNQLERVQWLAALGLSVIPVDHPAETTHTDTARIGKTPSDSWKRFQATPPDADYLRQWFGNGHQRNIGVVTGAVSNLVVIDLDSPEAVAWADAHLPATPWQVGTGHGQHRGYRHPGVPVGNKVRIRTGDPAIKIDVRGDGGYVVAPGSVHRSGVSYEFIQAPIAMSDLPVFDPAWLRIEEPPVSRQVRRARDRSEEKTNDQLLRRVGKYLANTPPAIAGEGGDTHTFTTICRVVRGFDLTDADALEVLRPWNARCQPQWSEAELREKIEGARKYGTEPIGVLAEEHSAVVLNPNDPLPSARLFVERNFTTDGILALRHQAGVFFAYRPDFGSYQERDEATVRSGLYKFMEGAKRWTEKTRTTPAELVPFQPNKSKVENVLDGLRAVTNLPTTQLAPCWLGDDPGLDPLDLLPLPNGLLHIPTRSLHPPSAGFFTLNGIDFPYDPWAQAPKRWHSFLNSLWPDDPESIAALQEIFGYVLIPDTRFQKIFLIVGPPRSGKGVIARILRRVIGDRNVCSPTLAAFGRDFGKQVLVNKTVAIISDARISKRTDTASVAETLLSISGEDAQTVERKFLPDWNGKLSTRFLLLTNELPDIGDSSGALTKRFIVLTLKESFYGKENLGLFEELLPELPAILNWALEGRDRLYARGHFVQPKSSSQLIEQFTNLSSPEKSFLEDFTSIEPGAAVPHQELFDAWKAWCDLNGRDRPGTSQTFGRNVRAALPWVTSRMLGPRGEQQRCWEGLRLHPQPKAKGQDPGM